MVAALSLFIVTLFASARVSAQDNPVVVMETNKGTIKIEVWQDKAPLSAANSLRYVDENYYDGLLFPRVIPGFMAQGGVFDEESGGASGMGGGWLQGVAGYVEIMNRN